MGVLRLVGGWLGIGALLAFLALSIWVAMWIALLIARQIPTIGRRHRHDRWSEMQQDGNRLPQHGSSARDTE
jgi:hypothetical protein